jgi:hypothetical protein
MVPPSPAPVEGAAALPPLDAEPSPDDATVVPRSLMRAAILRSYLQAIAERDEVTGAAAVLIRLAIERAEAVEKEIIRESVGPHRPIYRVTGRRPGWKVGSGKWRYFLRYAAALRAADRLRDAWETDAGPMVPRIEVAQISTWSELRP